MIEIVADPELLKQLESAPSDGKQAAPSVGQGRPFAPVSDPDILEQLGDPVDSSEYDPSTGAPFGTRFEASFKASEKGELNYYKAIFGENNVMPRADGIDIRPDPDAVPEKLKPFAERNKGKWMSVDEGGLPSLRDIFADSGGLILETGVEVGAVAATRGGSLLNTTVGAVGAGAGRGARHYASSLLPGDDEMTPGEITADIAGAAVLGGAVQGGIETGAAIFDRFFRPTNYAARGYKRRQGSETLAEGKRLSRIIGTPLTPGQEAGSRHLLKAEAIAGQSPGTDEQIHGYFIKQVDAALKKFDEAIAHIPEVDAPIVGERIKTIFDETTKTLLDYRRRQATADFSSVHSAAGKKKIIPLHNTYDAINDLLGEIPDRFIGEAKIGEKKQLENLLKQMDSGGDVSALELKNLLETWGASAKGTGDQFRDMAQASSKRYASTIFAALKNDLDDAVTAMTYSGRDDLAVAQSLAIARDNYKRNSDAITELDKSILHKVVGKIEDGAEYDPVKIAQRLLQKDYSEISIEQIMKRLPAQDADLVRRYFVEDMFNSSIPTGNSPKDIRAMPSKIVNWFNKNEKKLQKLFPRGDFFQFKQAALYLNRVADRAGMWGSQTAPYWEHAEQYEAIAQPSKWASFILKRLGNKAIANAMTTREGRDAILTMKRTSPKSKAYTNAVAYLGLLAAGEEIQ